jgi:hypothetical protein
MSVKDWWVDSHEKVLNVPIICQWYESGKPSNWLSTEDYLFSTASLAIVGEKMGKDPWFRQPSSCGLCRESFFSGVVDLYKYGGDFVKGCYALITWDMYGLGPYADWAWKVCGMLVGFCDRTPQKSRDLSPKIISRDSRWSENTQTQHVSVQYHDIQFIK